MKGHRSIAGLTLVALLGTGLPARAAGRATDIKGTSGTIQSTGKVPHKFEGFHPSARGWMWIGIGLGAAFLLVKMTVPSK